MKRNSAELKVKYAKGDGPKKPKNKNVDPKSELGYSRNSPFLNLPGIDIHTTGGLIDMSNTDIPLLANGIYLPKNSGTHKIPVGPDGIVREIPLAQFGKTVPGNIPVIDDAGRMVDGIWVPDWNKMGAQAKKLGAKTVKTKNGAIIYFDENWEVKNVDDNPSFKQGGWLEQYQTGSTVQQTTAQTERPVGTYVESMCGPDYVETKDQNGNSVCVSPEEWQRRMQPFNASKDSQLAQARENDPNPSGNPSISWNPAIDGPYPKIGGYNEPLESNFTSYCPECEEASAAQSDTGNFNFGFNFNNSERGRRKLKRFFKRFGNKLGDTFKGNCRPGDYGCFKFKQGGWLDQYQTGGTTVRELWESATGKPWSAAKESGLTTGSYADNKALKKRIMAGEFGKVKSSAPAPAAVVPANVVRPASPLYMQALNQSNKQAGARDASSTLGEQQRRAANILVSEGKVKPTKRDDTKAAPEGSVRSYVQKGVDYLDKMAKLSSAMNPSGTGWATELGTSFFTAPVQSGLNISNTVMGDRPIRNDSDILDLGIDVANVLPFAAEATPALKTVGKGLKAAKQEVLYRGIDPLGYGVRQKVKEFIPNLYKNTVRPNERAIRVGKELSDVTNAKALERIGKNRLDSWRVGLGLDQQYNTFTKLKDGTYKIKNTKQFDPEFFQSLQREINLSRRKSPNQVLIVDKAKDPAFRNSIYMEDAEKGIMGGYRWDIGKTDDGLLHFRSNDTWDLHPWKKRGAVLKEEIGDPTWQAFNNAHRNSLLENVEMLGVMGGKPYNISNNFIVDPKTFQIVKQWKQGGTMKNWLDRYQGTVNKSQTGKPLIIGTDANQSIVRQAPERTWVDTASDLYETVLDPFTYAGAGLDYASDWVKQQMGMKPEGELDPVRVRAMRQQAKGTATDVPAAVWQMRNAPLWVGNLVDQTARYNKTGDINAFQPALTGIAYGAGSRFGLGKLGVKQDGGESFGPVRTAGMPTVESGEGMAEVTRTQNIESFGEAFKRARAAGLKTFTWNGKTFGTKYKTEVEAEKKPAQKQPSAQKVSAPPRPMIDMSLKNIPISSKPQAAARPRTQVPIATRTAPVAKPAPTYASTPYSVAVTNPYGSGVTDRVAQANAPMGRMPARNISYGYQTAPASTTAVAGPMIGAGMQPVGMAPKTLPAKSVKPTPAKLQNQQPENIAADVRDFQNNLMGSMLSKLNQRTNVPMSPGRFQVGADPRQTPQSGIIVDKRTGEAYVKTSSSIYNYPVLTAANPDANTNPYPVEYLEKHPELKSTPRGYYTLQNQKTIDGELYTVDTSEDEGGLGRWMVPISAFGMPAAQAHQIAMHGTYMPDFANRNPRYTQSPEKRWVSFGCVNARECDLKQTFNDIAVGDTSMVLDSKFPEDAVLLEQIRREQMQKQPLMMRRREKYQGNVKKSQTGDPRQLPQTGIVVDKRTGEAYVRTNNSVYNFPVLTGRNPDLNANPYTVEYLENRPELRNTPTGYYTTYETQYDKSHSKDYEGELIRRLKPIPAFGTPAPVSTNVAMHGTYLADYTNRNKRYNQPANQRHVSYGCVNARECDLKKAFNDIAVGDTTLILDSKNAADAKLLSQLKLQRPASQSVRKKGGENRKDWLKNYQ